MKKQKTILVAPLFWGLGHATRCIPIIRALLENGYNVLLGSDGGALLLLRKEFPELPFIELPPYNITYPKKGTRFKLKLFLQLPEIQRTIRAEKKVIKKLVAQNEIDGIISDNRMGVRSKKVPSVFITHQLNVLSGNTSYFSSKMHQKIIKKYDACWVPDLEGPVNLSGKLGHSKKLNFPVTYIGPLSRMKKKELPHKYDILALLSGPEPQRTLLEEKIMTELKDTDKKILLVKGVVEEEVVRSNQGNIDIVNFLQTKELEKAINESSFVLSRSGYTTIMDLAALEKKAFFIPTPGQFEQEYLAKELKKKGVTPMSKQENFRSKKLRKIDMYKGFQLFKPREDYKNLFLLFERE